MSLAYPQLLRRLEEYLAPVLSSRRSAEAPARALIKLAPEAQQWVLHWANVIRHSNAELAFQFVQHAPQALGRLDRGAAEAWVKQALATYDHSGLYPGSAVLAELDRFDLEYRRRGVRVQLGEVRARLETFVAGLAGRRLPIVPADTPYTDTETLFLPPMIEHFDTAAANRHLYKTTAAYLWAQIRFGTYRRAHPKSPHLHQRLARFPDPIRALELFERLEARRLGACIARELPGLDRQMRELCPQINPDHPAWREAFDALSAQEAGVTDTFRATETLYALTGEPPQAQLWQGRLQPEAAANTLDARLQRDREALEAALQSLCAPPGESSEDPSDPPVATGDDPADSEQPPFELNIDGLAVPAPPNVTQLLQSLDEQLDQVPPEWLTAAGDAPYPEQPADTAEALDETPAADAIHYDEWDELRQSYRADWCTLREMESQAVEDDFPARTLDKYRHLVAALRRYFAALRGEPRTLRGQPDGPELDLDALITAQIDLRLGREPGDRLFTRPSKIERDLAVAFMVDASGSTKGWINQAERESLLLLCEALEELGDRYAIYGFSGMTRNRCEIYRIKTFNEPADAQVRARISGLQPRDYTRMGVAIRHICKQLQAVEARTRLLITLSDGKPDDYDGYRGDYGIADTRQALQEARQAGLQAFCITIDREAAGYLPRMYGAANYVVIDELHQLPLKVADIYRKLTT